MLYFYEKYSPEWLKRATLIYHSKNPTAFQKTRYEAVRAGLLAELRSLNPQAPDNGTAYYIHAAITAALDDKNRAEKAAQLQARANMQNAHNQLLNYDPNAKAKERR